MTETEFDIDAIVTAVEKLEKFAPGAPILRRGDQGEHAYIIRSGCVRIEQHGRTLETICAGEIFGEMGLVDGGPRMASAFAINEVEVAPIDRKLFASLIRDDEEFALTVMSLMARRLRATTEMLEACVAQAEQADADRRLQRRAG